MVSVCPPPGELTASVPPYGPVSVNDAVRLTESPATATVQELVSLYVRVTMPSSVAGPMAQLSNVRVRAPAVQVPKLDCTHEAA